MSGSEQEVGEATWPDESRWISGVLLVVWVVVFGFYGPELAKMHLEFFGTPVTDTNLSLAMLGMGLGVGVFLLVFTVVRGDFGDDD